LTLLTERVDERLEAQVYERALLSRAHLLHEALALQSGAHEPPQKCERQVNPDRNQRHLIVSCLIQVLTQGAQQARDHTLVSQLPQAEAARLDLELIEQIEEEEARVVKVVKVGGSDH
jgi:hypothetical protein